MLAVRKTIRTERQIGIYKVNVGSGAQIAINAIMAQSQAQKLTRNLVEDISFLAKKFRNMTFPHYNKKVNTLTDQVP